MKISSEQEMLDFGSQLGKEISTTASSDMPNIIELIGDVGAGKTTFVRGFAKGLDIKESITSPSFTISKSYACPNGKTLIHYDFYRLSDPGIMQEDLQEKLANPNNIIVVEWADTVANLLPNNRTIINIQKTDSGRIIDFENNPDKSLPNHTRPKQNETNRDSLTVTNTKKNVGSSTELSLYLDTSTPTTILKLNDKVYEWNSGRDLAENLLKFIHDKLQENNKNWNDISEITFMSGPGSFTGLRIGATVVNTLAHELKIPLKDHHGNLVQIIVPEYGRDANISKPRK